jgi:hypothetical protein
MPLMYSIHISLPEPMLFPYFLSHIFNGYILCFWNQKHSENTHDKNPSREKQEYSKLKETQHG